MSQPDITIALPTVDRIGFVEASLRSAAGQTQGSIEILLSDNSADARYGEQLGRIVERTRDDLPSVVIRVLTQPERVPMTPHANLLIQEARGRFWTYLSDDDLLLPHWAEQTSHALMRHPTAALAFSDHWIIDRDGVRDRRISTRHTKATGRSRLSEGLVDGDAFDEAALRWSIPLLGTLFRIEALREFGFTPDSDALDVDLILRMADRGGMTTLYLPQRLAEYRRHEANYSTRWSVIQRTSLVRALEGCPSLARRHPGPYRQALAEAYATLGKAALEEGSRKNAWKALRRALRLDPANRLAYRFLLQLPVPRRSLRSPRPATPGLPVP